MAKKRVQLLHDSKRIEYSNGCNQSLSLERCFIYVKDALLGARAHAMMVIFEGKKGWYCMELAKSLTAGPPLLFFLAVFQLKKGTKILHVV